MKKLKATFSLALTVVLVFSTLGFSVSRHYCMGTMVEESFYHFGSEDCGMEDDEHCGDPEQHLDMSCCADQNLIISGIQVLAPVQDNQSTDLDFPVSLPSPSFGIAHSSFSPNLNKNISPSPPALRPSGQRLLVLVQRFLI